MATNTDGRSIIEDFVLSKGGMDDPVEEIDELVVDGLKLRSISSLDNAYISTFKALRFLSMNQCQLNSILGLPVIPSLEDLEVHDNKLSGKEQIQHIVQCFPNLRALMMAANRFSDLEDFSPLNSLQNLEELDLEMNPLFAKADASDVIRAKLFRSIPSLKCLNGCDAAGNEIVSESDDDDDDEEDDDGPVKDLIQEDEQHDNDIDVDKKSGKSLLAQFMAQKFVPEDDEKEEDFDPDSLSVDSEEDDDDEEEEDEETHDHDQDNNGEPTSKVEDGAAASSRTSIKSRSPPQTRLTTKRARVE